MNSFIIYYANCNEQNVSKLVRSKRLSETLQAQQNGQEHVAMVRTCIWSMSKDAKISRRKPKFSNYSMPFSLQKPVVHFRLFPSGCLLPVVHFRLFTSCVYTHSPWPPPLSPALSLASPAHKQTLTISLLKKNW